MGPPLRLLIIEDNPAAAALLARRVREAEFELHLEVAGNREEAERALDNGQWNLILCGQDVPGFSPDAALKAVRQRLLDVPLVIVSGRVDEDGAVAAMRSGAVDYVMKDDLTRLVPVIERELRMSRLRGEQTATDIRTIESEMRFHELFNHMSSGVTIFEPRGHDRDFVIKEVNQAAQDICQHTKQELLGKALTDIFPGARDGGLLAAMQEVWETGRPQRLPVSRYDDGRLSLWMTHYVLRLPSGEMVCIFDDASERVEAEQYKTDQIRFLQELMDAIPVPIFYKDRQGNYQGCNASFEKHAGVTRADLVGQEVQDLADQVLAEVHSRQDQSLMDRPAKVHYEVRIEPPGKQGRIFLINKASYTDSRGEVAGLVGVIFDVTKNRKAEREAKELEGQLRQAQKLEAIGTLAGGITHDFNNILAAMLGYTELALSKTGRDSGVGHHLNQILKAGDRAKTLIGQVLTFSRQTAQAIRPLNPSLVVKEALKLLTASLPKTIEVSANIPAEPGYVLADPTQIHQIIMNLCTNAAHAMRERGGGLRVTIALREAGAVQPAVQRRADAANFICLTVEDQGTGMPRSVQDRIFDPYFTTKAPDEGTGLGLAVVHGIMKSLGGDIEVDSEPGRGTAFHLYFPCVEKTEWKEPVLQDEMPLGRENVMVVDDERDLTNIVRLQLTRLGYRVDTFNHSPRAWEVFAADPDHYQAVVTDWMMPKMSGGELIEKIWGVRPNTPVVVMSGLSECPELMETDPAGPQACLAKPVPAGELARKLRELLDEAELKI